MTETDIAGRLRKRRAELLGEIAAQDEAAQGVTAEDEEDRQQERAEDEVLSALSQADREELRRIDLALGKLADGTYGVCEECGQKIAPARLEAMPDAVLCIDCASKAEG